MNKRSMPLLAVCAAGHLVLSACSSTTPTAQKAATAALAQLSTYEVEVQRKIKAENDYYEAAMDAATLRVVELWDAEQPFQFEKSAKDFASSNLKAPAGNLGPKLIILIENMKTSWAQRDEKYNALLIETGETLRTNRQNLELEVSKIKVLRNKLQSLGAARSNKEMLALAIAFAKQVKSKYDELEAAKEE